MTEQEQEAMKKLLALARQINPQLPPDEELARRVVTISMSKDFICVDVESTRR